MFLIGIARRWAQIRDIQLMLAHHLFSFLMRHKVALRSSNLSTNLNSSPLVTVPILAEILLTAAGRLPLLGTASRIPTEAGPAVRSFLPTNGTWRLPQARIVANRK
jgi:hypothetical protein